MPNSIPGLKAGDETKDNSKASTSTEQLADDKVQSLFNCPSILQLYLNLTYPLTIFPSNM